MKSTKSFNHLLNKMEGLKETEQGKLKGGVIFISANIHNIQINNQNLCYPNDRTCENQGICFNTGNCSPDINTAHCQIK